MHGANTEPADSGHRDVIDPGEVANLDPTDPNVANSSEVVDHLAHAGELVDEDDEVIAAAIAEHQAGGDA